MRFAQWVLNAAPFAHNSTIFTWLCFKTSEKKIFLHGNIFNDVTSLMKGSPFFSSLLLSCLSLLISNDGSLAYLQQMRRFFHSYFHCDYLEQETKIHYFTDCFPFVFLLPFTSCRNWLKANFHDVRSPNLFAIWKSIQDRVHLFWFFLRFHAPSFPRHRHKCVCY